MCIKKTPLTRVWYSCVLVYVAVGVSGIVY